MNQTTAAKCDTVIQADPRSYFGVITNFYVRAHPDIGSNPSVVAQDHTPLKNSTGIDGYICTQLRRRGDNGRLMNTP